MVRSSADTWTLLRSTALRLFAERGYAATSIAQIATAAGVSHMTFFRHFPTKEAAVVGDLFDPVIAEAVAAQPAELPPLHRAVIGLTTALAHPDAAAELASEEFRTRLRIIAATPELAGAVWASTQATQDAVAAALTTGGTPEPDALAAAGALLGAASALLLDWAEGDTSAGADAAAHLTAGLTGLLDGVR